MLCSAVPAAGEILPLILPGVAVIGSRRYLDDRGWTAEAVTDDALRTLGWRGFAQENQNWSKSADIVRGLHYQLPPYGQAKIVRVQAGAVFSVAADIDPASPTFGMWSAATLDWRGGVSMFVPANFAHGVLSLEDGTLMSWLVDAPFHGPSAAGISWDDPLLAIDWPLNGRAPILSERDRGLPSLRSAC